MARNNSWWKAFIASSLILMATGEAVDATDPTFPSTVLGQFEGESTGFRGKVVFYARPRCRVSALQTPHVAELASHWRDQGVDVLAVIPPRPDGKSVQEFRDVNDWSFPAIEDTNYEWAEALDIRVVPEVFVFGEDFQLRYRGAINDRYLVGVQRAESKHNYLADAVAALIDGRPIAPAKTDAIGCRLRRPRAPEPTKTTYTRDIAPLLQKHCQVCHRPGMSGPFPLMDYEQTADWAEMICEVIDERLMPPWNADTRYGNFSNANVLSDAEKRTLKDWVSGGCLKGDADDLPPPVEFSSDWQIGTPDAVFTLKPFTVPAEGIIEYQYTTIETEFQEEKWIAAVEMKPSSPAVVHHCALSLVSPDGEQVIRLSGQAVGTPPSIYPPGTAKRLPPGWKLELTMHYQAVGTEQIDQTSIGIKLIDGDQVRKEVETLSLIDFDLEIPPHASHHRVEMTAVAKEDLLLLSLYPHMHLRGKDFRYEATYPNGKTDILLDVPRWDFNWQHRYQLAEPVRLPRGTRISAIAHYDNSADNPFNPDPDARVFYGEQSTDEMFNAYVDVVAADEDRTAFSHQAIRQLQRNGLPMASCGLAVIALGVLSRRFRRREA